VNQLISFCVCLKQEPKASTTDCKNQYRRIPFPATRRIFKYRLGKREHRANFLQSIILQTHLSENEHRKEKKNRFIPFLATGSLKYHITNNLKLYKLQTTRKVAENKNSNKEELIFNKRK